jgi:hypothetical protein
MMKSTLALVLVLASSCGSGSAGTKGAGGSGAGSTAATSTTASSGTGATTGTGTTTAAGTGGSTTATTGTGAGGAGTASTSSGATTSTGTGTSSGGACTVTLSGTETGTFTCSLVAAWSGSQNTTSFAFTPASTLPAGVNIAEGGGDFSGQPMVMAYPYSDFTKGSFGVSDAAGSVWESGPDNNVTGPQSVNITSVAVDIDTASAKTYTLHGTYDATCGWVNGTPDPGTTVTVHIDF